MDGADLGDVGDGAGQRLREEVKNGIVYEIGEEKSCGAEVGNREEMKKKRGVVEEAIEIGEVLAKVPVSEYPR